MEPKPPSNRLQQEQREQQAAVAGQQARQGQQFETVEEMLRQDRAETLPPETLEPRLRTTLAAEPPPPKASWWRKWLGR